MTREVLRGEHAIAERNEVGSAELARSIPPLIDPQVNQRAKTAPQSASAAAFGIACCGKHTPLPWASSKSRTRSSTASTAPTKLLDVKQDKCLVQYEEAGHGLGVLLGWGA